jgi:subtilase family serine protease
MFLRLHTLAHGSFHRAIVCILIALLAGCGGGSGGSASGADSALGTVTLELNMAQLPAAVAAQMMRPMASVGEYTIYTPAQIRAAYTMPALPAPGAALTQAQAAALGAGQTIYLIDAFHDPYIAQELAAFNTRFGLPACSVTVLGPSRALPLAGASTAGCELLVAASTSAGGISATAPAYDYGWATEIALDVQWAHATAPLARLVLIEAQDSSLASLLGAIKLANNMGPGVVSMSFGGKEGNWTDLVDSVFANDNMTYLAATGDHGPQVDWPAVASRVLAVGGTSLRFSDTGERSETSWSATGGGFSTYTPAPAYQSAAVQGIGGKAFRGVADVAMNADPATGQYVARIEPGATEPVWISAAGTSLATAQWAGVLAVANAQRALGGRPPLGAPHALLYESIASRPGDYFSAFSDVTAGSNGACSSCGAATGYDTLTGLGTPKVAGLLALLSQFTALPSAQTPPAPSKVISTTIGTDDIVGVRGLAMAGSIVFSDPSSTRLKVTITGVPSGLELVASGPSVVAKWAKPRAGSYNLQVQATNDVGQTALATVRIKVN